MWCIKCGNGHANYNWKKCGQCQGTDLTDKNPFIKEKKRKQKKDDNKKQPRRSSTREDVEAITTGRIKPTVMR